MANIQDSYSHGYTKEAIDTLANRRADEWAGFFLPYLKSGMSLLDCGCGPGTITIGLADVVAPGKVVGIDVEQRQIDRAISNANDQGITNVRFEVASAYELPFPDESFDAVFAHTLLQHLGDPMRGLGEIYRILKPGGVVGVREEDAGSRITAPDIPIIEQAMELYMRYFKNNGGDPLFARRHREVLRRTGFTRITASATATCQGNPDETQSRGDRLSQHWLEPVFADRVIELGWADRETLEAMSAAWKEWGQHPDAYWAMVHCQAIGWKE